jgi:hypothetical protein
MPVMRGLQLGVRIGYSLPTGHLGGDSGNANTALSDLETAIVPLGLDAGFRLSPQVYVGGTAAWAPGTDANAPNPCKSSAVSCSRHDVQLRAEARYYFAPHERVGGWFAVGAGWEVATFSQTVAATTTTATRTGPVLADFQLGFDIRSERTAVGLYLGVSLATFMTQGVNPASPPVPTWIHDQVFHEWITFGIRGSYGPW